MARPRTRTRVHAAVLELAQQNRLGSITMECVAARAGVSKQTLYRTWPSTGAILFDALLSRSQSDDGVVVVPDSGDLVADLRLLVAMTIDELTSPIMDPLLRAVTADIQTDDVLAEQFREQLLAPQLAAISRRLTQGNIDEPETAAELLMGPILYRWLLRTADFDASWATSHVNRVLKATATRGIS